MNEIPRQLPIIVIAGPTASGKSALGLAVAERFRGTVINADSMQVYRDLRILTARPTPEEEARVPHRLYGHRDAAFSGSMAHWRADALQAVAEAARDGRLPVLVGGTGLYLRSLFDGIVEVPEIPPELRQDLRRRAAGLEPAELFDWLRQTDPEAAASLRPHDAQRILRALEVRLGTGIGLREWQRRGNATALPNPVAWILLRPPRAQLYARIDRRFQQMVEAGALDEARTIAARTDLPADAPVRKAHGLPELLDYLAGRRSLGEAVAIAQANTRHYAKRQTTWFRHQITPGLVEETDLGAKENFNPEVKIFPFIVRYLLTAGVTPV